MTEYLGTIQHFKLAKDGDTLVATSWKVDGFEKTFPWPREKNVDDEDLLSEIHDLYYTELVEAYNDFS